jgi:hypothetical protein
MFMTRPVAGLTPPESTRMSLECRAVGVRTCSFDVVGEKLENLIAAEE